MYKYFILSILFVLTQFSDVFASEKLLPEGTQDQTSPRPAGWQPGLIEALLPEVVWKIAYHLDPLNLSRLLRTNRELGEKFRTQTDDRTLMPIHFGQRFVEEFKEDRKNGGIPKTIDEYIHIMLRRSAISFNSIFGATLTWNDILTKLEEQKTFFFEEVRQQENVPFDILCFGLTTYVFLQSAQEFFPAIATHVKNEDYQRLFTIKRVFGPSGDYFQWDLSCAFWQAKVYHDLIGLDMLGGELREQKSRGIVVSSLPAFMRQIRVTLPYFHWSFPLKNASKGVSQSIVKLFEDSGLSFAYEQDQVDAQRTLNTTLFQAAMAHTNSALEQLYIIPQLSVSACHLWGCIAFLYEQTIEFAEDVLQKAQLYRDAGQAKSDEAELLDDESDRQKKRIVLAQAATFYEKAAEAYTDANQKGFTYYQAGTVKAKEASLLNAEDERQQRREVWSQAAIYYVKEAENHTNVTFKAKAYSRATNAMQHALDY